MLHRILKPLRLAPLAGAVALASLAGAAPASAACNSVGLSQPSHHVVVCSSVQGASAAASVDVCLDWSFPCQRVVDLGRTGATAGSTPTVEAARYPQIGVRTNTTTVATAYVNGDDTPVTVTGVCAGPSGSFCP